MNKKLSGFLKITISVLLAVGLMWWVFKGIDYEEFMSMTDKVDYTWVVISMFLSVIGNTARAYRWNLLLNPLGYRPSTYRTSVAVFIGYLVNLALPRVGEVTKCAVLTKTDGVPISKAIGTVITERIVDLVMLVAVLGITLLLEFDRIVSFFEMTIRIPDNWIWGVVVLLLMVPVGIFILLRIIKGRSKVAVFVRDIVQGLLTLRKLQNLTGFIISTAIIWAVYYFMSFTIVFSLSETAHLDWEVGLTLLVVGGIAMALPVQSGFGTYHALVSAMLVLYSVEKTTGVFLATLLHTSQVLTLLIVGGVAAVLYAFIKPQTHVIEGENTNA
jgi:glycosyltransferase 2 family protein